MKKAPFGGAWRKDVSDQNSRSGGKVKGYLIIFSGNSPI